MPDDTDADADAHAHLPESVADTVKDVHDALGDGQYTAAIGAPDGREVTAPIAGVSTEPDTHPATGRVLRVDVDLDMDRDEWRANADAGTTEPIDYTAPIMHAAFPRLGVTKPAGISAMGVRTSREVAPGRIEPAVTVQGYIPLPGGGRGVAADGGLSLVGGMAFDTLAIYGVALPPLVGMARLLTDIGEEFTVKENLDTTTFTVGVYDDAQGTADPAPGGDGVNDTADYDWTNPNIEKRGTSITTEPTGASYSAQSQVMSIEDLSGNWGVRTDSDAVFDTSDSDASVDSWYAGVSFLSDDFGETTASNHLLCTGALSQAYDFPGVTQVTVNAGGVGWTLN